MSSDPNLPGVSTEAALILGAIADVRKDASDFNKEIKREVRNTNEKTNQNIIEITKLKLNVDNMESRKFCDSVSKHEVDCPALEKEKRKSRQKISDTVIPIPTIKKDAMTWSQVFKYTTLMTPLAATLITALLKLL